MIVLYCPTCGSWKLSKRDNGYTYKCHECLDIFYHQEAEAREVEYDGIQRQVLADVAQ